MYKYLFLKILALSREFMNTNELINQTSWKRAKYLMEIDKSNDDDFFKHQKILFDKLQ